RVAAQIVKGKIALGGDPIEEKRKERESRLTFGEHFRDYMENHSRVNKKSWQYDEREIQRFLSHWFNRRLVDIRKNEVRLLHEKIRKENGLYQANRILERVRALYNKALEWGWEGVNPAIGIKKFKEKSRDRFILPSE